MIEILTFTLGLDFFEVRWRNPLYGPVHEETFRFRLSPGRKQLHVATTGWPPQAPEPELHLALEKAGHWMAIRDLLIAQELNALAKQFGETVLEEAVAARRKPIRDLRDLIPKLSQLVEKRKEEP